MENRKECVGALIHPILFQSFLSDYLSTCLHQACGCAQTKIKKIKKEEKICNKTFLALTKTRKKRKRFTKRRKNFLVIMERIKN